jgi:hypothetical protein
MSSDPVVHFYILPYIHCNHQLCRPIFSHCVALVQMIVFCLSNGQKKQYAAILLVGVNSDTYIFIYSNGLFYRVPCSHCHGQVYKHPHSHCNGLV